MRLTKQFMMLIGMVIGLVACQTQADEKAVEAFKQDPKVQEFLADKKVNQFTIEYDSLKLGGICGFTGCEWRALVSLVVTSKAANAPSDTITAIVSGFEPANGRKPLVVFVSLSPLPENTIQ